MAEVCRETGVSRPTCSHRRKRHGGPRPAGVRKPRQLVEEGNVWLRRPVSDLSLGKEMPQEVSRRKTRRLPERGGRSTSSGAASGSVSGGPAGRCRRIVRPTTTAPAGPSGHRCASASGGSRRPGCGAATGTSIPCSNGRAGPWTPNACTDSTGARACGCASSRRGCRSRPSCGTTGCRLRPRTTADRWTGCATSRSTARGCEC